MENEKKEKNHKKEGEEEESKERNKKEPKKHKKDLKVKIYFQKTIHENLALLYEELKKIKKKILKIL